MPPNPSAPRAVGMNSSSHAPTPPPPHPSASLPSVERGLPVPDFPWDRSITWLLADYEQRLIDHAMRNAEGVKRQAASLLGISRYALERRIRRLRALRDKSETGEHEIE